MDKRLKLHARHPAVDMGYLVERQLACEHHSAETHCRKPFHFLGRAVVGLRTGMERQRHPTARGLLDGDTNERHVLHEQRIGTCIAQLAHQPSGLLQLMFVYDSIDRDIDAGTEAVGIQAQ